MNDPFLRTYHQLSSHLKFAQQEFSDSLSLAQHSATLCKNALFQLRNDINKHKFKNAGEEIHFFKTIKSPIFAQFIFHHEVYNIELNKPITDGEDLLPYLEFHKKIIQDHYEVNKEFYKYNRGKQEHLDTQYFTRIKNYNAQADPQQFCLDQKFNTSHDYLLAQVLANKKLLKYLKAEKNKTPLNTSLLETPEEYPIKWTDSKTALVELIYALHSNNSINNGNATIKEISLAFSHVLGLDLSDIYHTFKEIKERQNPTRFLDQLNKALTKTVEQQFS